MKKLTIAYFGTPYFSAFLLERILTDSTVNQLTEMRFVVTQPDKPVGRKQHITKSPVKIIAEKYHIPVLDSKIQDLGSRIKNLDFAFLYAYGGIIPDDLLHLPKLGFLNTHPSLLPKYRGSSPIAYPLILGDTETGVTLIQLDKEIDHGPIIAQETLPINPTDRRPDLEIKLTDLAFNMFKKLITELTSLRASELESKEQNHKRAVYARMLTKTDGFIPFSTLQKALKNTPLTFEELPEIIEEYLIKYPKEKGSFSKKTFNFSLLIFNLFRGFYPWPGIWTIIQPDRLSSDRPKRLKITDLSLSPKPHTLIPIKVQLEGKKEVDFETFNNAYRVFTP